MRMKLIVNADDFGYSKGVNLGIMEAHKNGIVTSATMMCNMPGLAHAVELAKDMPSLGVGIHLVLTCGSPVSPDVPSLVDEAGQFRKRPEQLEHAEPADIEREFVAQIERFLSTGLRPTHLDSHHHVHSHEKVFPIVRRLAERYQLPLRRISMNPSHEAVYQSIKTTKAFDGSFYGEHVTVDTLAHILQQYESCETVELMCHPAFIDQSVLTGSSYTIPRSTELAVLTDERAKEIIMQGNIELITYKEIV